MARLLLKNENFAPETGRKNNALTSLSSDRDLLKKRSKKYLDTIKSLDQKSLTGTKGMNELMETVQEEFGTAEIASLPLGIVSKCFLGTPYEVHTLDLSGTQIIRHYKIAEAMNTQFEKGRGLALHNAYAMVEIYRDKMILIREDGTATKL